MLSLLYIWAFIFGLASGAKLLDQSSLGQRSDHTDVSNTIDDSARRVAQDRSKAAEQNIIICNAYAHTKPLDVINLRTQQPLTEDGPLSYKSCRDLGTSLLEGDRLEFKAGNASAGVFRATGIPRTRAALMLIPYRRDYSTLSAAFESHAFAETGNPQVAIIDTYKGNEVSKIKIMDAKSDEGQSKEPREEELRFNSVVGLGAGSYQVLLQSDSQQDIAKEPLQVAASPNNYVVMRTGLQGAPASSAFPQELVVYSEQRSSRSLASARPRLPALAAALAAALAGLAAAAL